MVAIIKTLAFLDLCMALALAASTSVPSSTADPVTETTSVPGVDQSTSASTMAQQQSTQPSEDSTQSSSQSGSGGESGNAASTQSTAAPGATAETSPTTAEQEGEVTGTAAAGLTTVTQEVNGNTTMATDDNSTTTAAEKILCHRCEGADCVNTNNLSQNDSCVSEGVCYMVFDLTNETISRGCNATQGGAAVCADTHPAGQFALSKCEYCCTGNKCNSDVLTKQQCENLKRGDSGSAPVRSELTGTLAGLVIVSAFIKTG